MCANGIWPKQQENKIKDETKQNAAAAVRKTHRESRTSLLSYAIVGSFCTASATSLKLSLAFDIHGGGGWRGTQGKNSSHRFLAGCAVAPNPARWR